MKTGGIFFTASIALLISFSSCATREGIKAVEEKPYYSEQYRPQLHFTPDSMWMNDPNGMVYYEGEYHLFYQHHPHSNVWGPMHWGHAISKDLVHWEHMPIALYPDSLGTIFSGSAVIDWNNSSGFGKGNKPPMVAIFTHHNHELEKTGSDLYQYQSIAYSLDKGRSWTKYSGNPVLSNPGIRDFRDPNVSWYEAEQKWIMVFAAQDRIMFYTSPNLIDWEKESEFLAEKTPGEGVWECPDFFPLKYNGEEKWVLIVSIGDGGPNGGSGTKYYVGDFDGNTFTCEDPSCPMRWIDFGKDNYAGVTWSDIPEQDGRRIFMGWMSNWQYAQKAPSERWRSAMTLPRELKLDRDNKGYLLRSVPLVETQKLREEMIKLETGPDQSGQNIGPIIGEAYPLYEIDLLFEFDTSLNEEDLEFGIVLESARHEQVVAGFNASTQKIHFSRQQNSGKTDFSEHFPGVHLAPYDPSDKTEIRFHAFVDLSSIELFVNDGAVVMTELVFPESGFESIHWYRSNNSVKLKEGAIYRLKSAW